MAASSFIGSASAHLLQSYRVPVVDGACSEAAPGWCLHPQGLLHIQLYQLILYILHDRRFQVICKVVMAVTACCLRQRWPQTMSYEAIIPH